MNEAAAAATIEKNRRLVLDLASMVPPSNTPASERARLEEPLALIDLLISLSDETVGGQRVLAEEWRWKQPDLPTRPIAIRQLVQRGLRAKG